MAGGVDPAQVVQSVSFPRGYKVAIAASIGGNRRCDRPGATPPAKNESIDTSTLLCKRLEDNHCSMFT
jgi:hypothetical protein